MQNLAGNTEVPKLPQEEHSALSLLVNNFTVASPVQLFFQMNIEIFILLHHSSFTTSPVMEIMFEQVLFVLKSTIIYFVVSMFKMRQLLPHHATQWSTNSLYSASQ
ncbi:hypothetical protein ILYODFUR_022160 [Ilyodon furcidens]|uniref:Uncharacterized protein n=2 Tax=Goodeidae TaxID=28758 RepID=A0ABU7B5V1_9TELE|nr:hypothetical protein [Ataeniobius toweri]